MIKTLEIENFKSIHQGNVSLKGLNILIGQNGAGKSNFVSLFRILERLVDQRLSEYIFKSGGINHFLFNGFEHSDYIKVKVELSPAINSYNIYEFEIEIDSSGENYQFASERVGFWIKNRYPTPYTSAIVPGKQESNIKRKKGDSGSDEKIAKYVYEYLKDLKVFHFHDSSDNAPLKLPQDIDDVYFLKNEAENIAPFLMHLSNSNTSTYNRIVETVRLVYPSFNDFELKESPTAKGKVILRWTEKGTDNIFTIKQISDGTLRFICLATLLLQPGSSDAVPKTIIMDEPELGLHPFAINILSELIKKAALERQIIIATQSVTLVSHFDVDDLIIVERNQEGETIFSNKTEEDVKEWLDDFSLGELWENNFLGGRP